LENARNTPTLRLDHGVAIFRQDARQIVDQTAASDVGEAFDHASRNFREQWLIIFVHAQKFRADCT